MNPFIDSDDDDNLGIDIFAALKGAVQSQDVQAAWSKVKSPLPAIQGISGGPKAPVLPSWLTQFAKPITTLTKAVVQQVKSQPTTAPASSPSTGEPLLPSAGGAPGKTPPATNTMMILAGVGLAGAAAYFLTRRRR
jgi:MYXO-CTERM domain-containing protein